MKILHTVEFYTPSKGGAQEVVRQLSERMVQLGHDVTVATTKLADRKQKVINGVGIAEFDIHGNQVVGISGEAARYKQFLTQGTFDVILNYAAQQWATDLAFEVIDGVKGKKFIAPCGYSALDNPDFSTYFDNLPAILKKYNASIYLTKRYQDYRFAREHGLHHLAVIPNGADEHEFQDGTVSSDFRADHNIKNFMILAVSNHTGAKGHRETLETFEEFPYPSTLVIIGDPQAGGCYQSCKLRADRINKRPDKRVLLVSLPRQETIAAFKSADVFLFLSNIESGPIVLLESAAANLPFISTNVGSAEEIASWTHGGFIAKTIPDPVHNGSVFADIETTVEKLVKLHNNERLRKKLGEDGHKNWAKHFTWEKITKRYLNLYEGKRP